MDHTDQPDKVYKCILLKKTAQNMLFYITKHLNTKLVYLFIL